jgi:hypothetical protein
VARIYEARNEQAIGLDTFFDNVAAIQAPCFSDEYIDACARELSRLANNRELVWNHLARGGLEEWGRSFSPPQSFILGMAHGLLVRANIWLPPKHARSETDAYYRRIYSYDLAHNHDFHLLTVGYFGPGYETDLYEVDAKAIAGIPGDQVTLGAHRREQLTPGRVIYFKAYSDVHVQHEPSELSISLNLIFGGERLLNEQLIFDLERSRIIGSPKAGVSGRWWQVVEMARVLGNGRTWELFEEIAEKGVQARIREAARDALRRDRGSEMAQARSSADTPGGEVKPDQDV